MILIIIFLGIYFIKKNEHFNDSALNCDVTNWGNGFLYGCSYIENGSHIINLLWKKEISGKKYVIINPLDNDIDTLIIDNIDVKTLTNKIFSYKIPSEYIEPGKTYLITLNYSDSDNDTMMVSNTIQIKVNKQSVIDSNSGDSCHSSTQLFDSLKNKIFDIYVE
tara:strand:- start:7 stop:498 length:492 start_codon:yes stop_codon:yes gene_type:complete